MDVQRLWVARAINPKKKDPPQCCIDSKTICMDTFKTKLFLFRDTRPQALEYVEEILPTLIDTATKKEDAIKWYKSLEHDWIEFDFTTNQLSLCSLKKTKP